MRAYNLIINIIDRFILFDFNYQLVAGNFCLKREYQIPLILLVKYH